MRTIPAGFITEKNRITGSRPAWVLRIMVDATPLYISDRIITNFKDPDSGLFFTTKAWVSNWGQILEGITGELGEYSISEFSVSLAVDLNDPFHILYVVDNHDIETGKAVLFAWYDTGLGQAVTFPGQVMFSGYVKEVSFEQNDSGVNLSLQDDTLKLRNKVGGIVDVAVYPDADPDEIGKVIPVIIGSLEKFPCLAIDAGIKTSISIGMTAIQTTMTVSDPSGFWVGMWAGIDDETVLVTGITGSVINITRGHDATIPTTHTKGTDVLEIRSNDFAFQVADHAVTSISKVWGRWGQKVMDITPIATVYTGQPGNEYPAYPGKAVVTVPGFITITQANQLLINDGIGVADAITIGDTIAVSDTIGISDAITIGDTISVDNSLSVNQGNHAHIGSSGGVTVVRPDYNVSVGPFNPANAYDNNLSTYMQWQGGNSRIGRNAAVSVSLPLKIRACITYTSLSAGNLPAVITVNNSAVQTMSLGNTGGAQITVYSGWFTFTDITKIYYGTSNIYFNSGTLAVNVYEVWWEIESGSAASTYSTADGVALSGTIAKTGGATRSGSVTKTGGATKTGNVTRSGSVTKTGSVTLSGNSVSNTLIGDAVLVDVVGISNNTPLQAISWLLANYGDYAGAITQVGVYPDGYNVNGAITESNSVLYWINRIAFEFRSFFKFSSGSAKLFVRPDSFASVKTITKAQTNNFTRTKTAYEDILNIISIRYKRDFTKARGISAYQGITTDQNDASISRYGKIEKVDNFFCDFITSSALAISVRAFYLSWYSSRHWIYSLECFLDQVELEFGDQVAIEVKAGAVGMIKESGISPGNSGMDQVNIKIEI